MGNQIALCIKNRICCTQSPDTNHKKVLRIMKTDGKIIELESPILVKDLLLKFPKFGVSISSQHSQEIDCLPPSYELKVGKLYHLLHLNSSSTVNTTTKISDHDRDHDNVEECGDVGIKRIKVIITKKQLEELLSKRATVEELMLGMVNKEISSTSTIDCSMVWRPSLETIPEESY